MLWIRNGSPSSFMSSIECKPSFEKLYGMAGLHLEFSFILLLCPSFPINGRIFFRRPNLTIRQLSIALQNRKTTLVVIFFLLKTKKCCLWFNWKQVTECARWMPFLRSFNSPTTTFLFLRKNREAYYFYRHLPPLLQKMC